MHYTEKDQLYKASRFILLEEMF